MVPSDEAVRGVAEEIGHRLGPERVILFGSRARGTATPESDADLLVVMSHDGSDRQQAHEVLRALDCRFPLDLIVQTASESPVTRDERTADLPRIIHEMSQAVREALARHRRLGNPVAIWRDGRVQWIRPEDIPPGLGDPRAGD